MYPDISLPMVDQYSYLRSLLESGSEAMTVVTSLPTGVSSAITNGSIFSTLVVVMMRVVLNNNNNLGSLLLTSAMEMLTGTLVVNWSSPDPPSIAITCKRKYFVPRSRRFLIFANSSKK